MIVIQSRDLVYDHLETRNKSQFSFLGKTFLLRRTFPKSEHKVVLEDCRKHLDSGYLCVVVENENNYTLCCEISQNCPNNSAQKPPLSVANPQQKQQVNHKTVRDILQEKYAAGERNFRGVNLENQILAKLDLSGANFTGANLTGVDFHSAILVGTNLSQANLTNANLEKADLTKANLTKTNLTGANLNGIKLTGANLRGITMPDGTTHH